MRNAEVLDRFEKHGRAAGALLGFGNPESLVNAEKRIAKALTVYHNHPHLQEKMHHIALSFAWNFIARLEQDIHLQQSAAQQGVRL